MLNLPMGDTVALQHLVGKYQYEPGFINVYGILERPGSIMTGIPTLANPSDPVNSPGIFTDKNDWNGQHTSTGRASLLWKPSDQFNADIAVVYSNVNGDGGPVANSTFRGGPYLPYPQQIFPAGGPYQDFAASDEPFNRKTALTSLDLSFDAGFATLSSTSSLLHDPRCCSD